MNQSILIGSLILLVIIDLYFFFFQRAAIEICREGSIEPDNGKLVMMPNWYMLYFPVKIIMWAVYIIIAFKISWLIAIFIFVLSFIVSTFIPTPHKHFFPKFMKQLEYEVFGKNACLAFEVKSCILNIKEKIGEEEIEAEQKCLSLEEKADQLVDSARVFIGIIEGKFCRQYPGYFSEVDTNYFTFFGTIATVWVACVRLHYEVDEELRTPLELRTREACRAWHPDAEKEYENVHQYVSERLLTESDRKKRGELLFRLASLWVIQRTMERIATESDIVLARELEEMISNETSGYWE